MDKKKVMRVSDFARMNDEEKRQVIKSMRVDTEKLKFLAKRISSSFYVISETMRHRIVRIASDLAEIDQVKIKLGIEWLLQESEAIEAICEHFEHLLHDERLMESTHNHKFIRDLYENILEQSVGSMERVLASVQNKKRAKKGGLGKAKKANWKAQKAAIQSHYIKHKSELHNKVNKTKEDVAVALQEKEIEGVFITMQPSTIRKYLRGL